VTQPSAPDDLVATRFAVADGVALLTLYRPDRMNAWTGRMEREYRTCLAAAEANTEVRVVVVTGAGRAICAGADLVGLDRMADNGAYDDGQRGVPLPSVMADPLDDFTHNHTFPLGMSKPVIAAVNGAAAGVGFVLLCFADIRFAARQAKLTTSFARLGLPAEHGVSWILSRLIGAGRAADLLFSSRVVLAEEAAEWGLINRVFEPDDLLPETLRYAKAIAAECSPASLRVIKQQLYGDLLGRLGPSAKHAYALMEEMAAKPDFAEGVAAFAEKRLPRFGAYPAPAPDNP
jgi:enoyl-CoA hydratase/carnithine racemase